MYVFSCIVSGSVCKLFLDTGLVITSKMDTEAQLEIHTVGSTKMVGTVVACLATVGAGLVQLKPY